MKPVKAVMKPRVKVIASNGLAPHFFFSVFFAMAIVPPTLSPTLAWSSPDRCDEAIDSKGKPRRGADPQLSEQCAAAWAADKASKADLWGGAIYAVSAGVCWTACLNITQTSSATCQYSSIGAGIADMGATAILTHEYEASIQGIASSASGFAMVSGAKAYDAEKAASMLQGPNQDGSTISGEDPGRDSASCFSAIMNTGFSVLKFMASKDQSDVADAAREAAAALRPHSPTFAVRSEGPTASAENGAGQVVVGSSATPPQNTPATSDTPCAMGAKDDPSGGKFVACAVANNKSFKFLKDPNVQKEFEKSSGQTLGQFFQNLGPNPSADRALKLATANAGEKEAFNAILGKVKLAAAQNSRGGSTYARGGGASGSAKGKGIENALGDTLKNLMSGMQGDGGEKTTQDGIQAVDLRIAKLSPKELEQDSTISIFSRVGYRYKNILPRVETLPFASPYNNVVANTPSRTISSDK